MKECSGLRIAVRVALASLLTCVAAAPALGASETLEALFAGRVKNPFFISLGSFAGNAELGSMFDTNITDYTECHGNAAIQQDLAILQALGLDFSAGVEVATPGVSFRISDRFQTFGLTHNSVLGRPHSVFGADALFRAESVYFGPGYGFGYSSARSGMTFQGSPVQVLSAVVGCDMSQTSFAEARLQTASAEAYRVASVSFGLRF